MRCSRHESLRANAPSFPLASSNNAVARILIMLALKLILNHGNARREPMATVCGVVRLPLGAAKAARLFCPKIRTTGGGRMTAWVRCRRCSHFCWWLLLAGFIASSSSSSNSFRQRTDCSKNGSVAVASALPTLSGLFWRARPRP